MYHCKLCIQKLRTGTEEIGSWEIPEERASDEGIQDYDRKESKNQRSKTRDLRSRIPCKLPIPTFREEVVDAVNEYRSLLGLHALRMSKKLCYAAKLQCEYMCSEDCTTGSWKHIGIDGEVHENQLFAAGYRYRWASEIVSRGQNSAGSFVNAVMSTRKLRERLLAHQPTEIGVFMMKGLTGSIYWCQFIAAPERERA